MKEKGTITLEKVYHFRCRACDRWWSIADAPGNPGEREWWCPWCGERQPFDDKTPKTLS